MSVAKVSLRMPTIKMIRRDGKLISNTGLARTKLGAAGESS